MSGAQKSVEELRREAHQARVELILHHIDPPEQSRERNIILQQRIDALADAAEEAQKERDAATEECARRADMPLWGRLRKRIAELERELEAERAKREEAEARISNEVAARQRAQEHGIGDRARIEELERERDEARREPVNIVSLALDIFEDAKPSTPEERKKLKAALLRFLETHQVPR
jgi:hypothetical protein